MFQHTDTSGDTPRAIGPATPSLPDWLTALDPSEDQIRNTGWAGYPGEGYWPRAITAPMLGPDEVLTGELASYEPDPVARVWRGVQAKRTLTAAEVATRAEAAAAAVDVERDRRIAAGFAYQGATFQSRPEDFVNLGGASTAAVAAVLNGAQPGDLRWADPTKDFAWIAADNGLVPLDAPGMIQLGSAAMAHRSRLIFAGSTIKARIRAGEAVGDMTADALWT